MSQSPPATVMNIGKPIDTDMFGNVTFWTPSLDDFVRTVSRWIKLDIPGGMVYGVQRAGKSFAADYLRIAGPTQFGGTLACEVVSMGDEPPGTDYRFLQRCLIQTKCKSFHPREPEVLRERLVSHLLEKALAGGSERILLIWDEAQNFERRHLGLLLTLYNELVRVKLRPFFLLVGQPELSDFDREYLILGAQNLVGRFFSVKYEFKGVAIDDFEEVLDAMDAAPDAKSEVVSGPVRYLPRQYSEGFRMKHLAQPLAEAVRLLALKHKMPNGLRLPMQYLRSSVICVLLQMQEEELHHGQINTTTLLNALEAVGFLSVALAYAESAKA